MTAEKLVAIQDALFDGAVALGELRKKVLGRPQAADAVHIAKSRLTNAAVQLDSEIGEALRRERNRT